MDHEIPQKFPFIIFELINQYFQVLHPIADQCRTNSYPYDPYLILRKQTVTLR